MERARAMPACASSCSRIEMKNRTVARAASAMAVPLLMPKPGSVKFAYSLYAIRIAMNAHEADELAQEAFLRLWERWDRVGALENPVGYLYRTAMNEFRSRMRRALAAARRVMPFRGAADEFAQVDERDAVARALGLLTR